MTKGLITRIGEWIDYKWQAKATEIAVGKLALEMGTNLLTVKDELRMMIIERSVAAQERIQELDGKLTAQVLVTPRQLEELKERLGHLEVYVGMSRKVDPTKPAVAKSAFAM